MPRDEKGRFWPEYKDSIYSNGVTNYKPPPKEDDKPPPPHIPNKTKGGRW